MPRTSAGIGPIITLATDFGIRDSYVAEMKLALLKQAPTARLIDVTHQIEPHDVLAGSFQLLRIIQRSDRHSFHLVVVDPGVGSTRRILVAEVRDQTIVCPDNGLITWPWRVCDGRKVWELHWSQDRLSNTFHGRDIMAPAIGKLAAGWKLQELASPITDPILLDGHLAKPGGPGRIIHIDHFGNATTTIPASGISTGCAVRVGRRNLGPVRQTYSDVAPGRPLALIGSADLLEIAIRNGSAARTLRLKIGDEVKLAD